MEKHKLFFAFCFIVFSFTRASQEVKAAQDEIQRRGLISTGPGLLFVFGDSYADTRNANKTARSRKVPYGITFPGKPSGRNSDGRVLTDYFARFLGLKTPVAYKLRKYAVKLWKIGMNFAYGGSGVFDTLLSDTNMTTQINYFQNLVKEHVYTKWDLKNAVVLVTLSGNDYGNYLAKGGSTQGLPNFIPLVVNQLAVNLKRIGGMGVGKVVVGALQPLGCLPQSTFAYSFKQCDPTANKLSNLHNLLLQQAVSKLNNENKGSPYLILDFYSSFLMVLGSGKFQAPLKPCCMGINSTYFCSDVDRKGNKMYTVCSDPESAFFWDTVHPTQAGWRAVYLSMKFTLKNLIF